MFEDHFRRALEEMDLELVRKIWGRVRPGLPQPENEEDCLIAIHMARTSMYSVRFKLRAYSHAWLVERDLPSLLPDELRPRAQRIYPVVREAVGIATRTRTPVALEVRAAMEDVVLNAGVRHPRLKDWMTEARFRVRKRFGLV